MSYKIIVKGEAKTKYKNLKDLDGISCQENFTEYFDTRTSYCKNIGSGYMHFEFIDKKLWTITEYYSDRELTNEELNNLSDYTTGQWSDGIGEGFEQVACMYDENGKDIYISPRFREQVATITQEESDKIVENRMEKEAIRDKKLKELNVKLSKTLKDAEDFLKNYKK